MGESPYHPYHHWTLGLRMRITSTTKEIKTSSRNHNTTYLRKRMTYKANTLYRSKASRMGEEEIKLYSQHALMGCLAP